MKKIILAAALLSTAIAVHAQDKEKETKQHSFKKENLFTGGNIILSFSNYTSVLGASPVFGYSINKWLDAGILFNYTYSSDRHVVYSSYDPNTGFSSYYISDDKLKQSTYGPGAFVKIYPINFLFVQAQGEFNSTSSKIIYANGAPTEKRKVSAPSFLVGAGYCSGREGTGSLFYYLSVMVDIAKDKDSPYTEITTSGSVRLLPIIKAGFQIPLFQGGGRHRRD